MDKYNDLLKGKCVITESKFNFLESLYIKIRMFFNPDFKYISMSIKKIY